MASKEKLRALRRKYGLGEFKKKDKGGKTPRATARARAGRRAKSGSGPKSFRTLPRGHAWPFNPDHKTLLESVLASRSNTGDFPRGQAAVQERPSERETPPDPPDYATP